MASRPPSRADSSLWVTSTAWVLGFTLASTGISLFALFIGGALSEPWNVVLWAVGVAGWWMLAFGLETRRRSPRAFKRALYGCVLLACLYAVYTGMGIVYAIQNRRTDFSMNVVEFVLLILPTALLFASFLFLYVSGLTVVSQRTSPGQCPSCGYNAIDLKVCPECGTAQDDVEIPKAVRKQKGGGISRLPRVDEVT